ncbi:homogentisate 1,2-dioxygenase [Ilumatobacter coccineus]|uniref:Putative oxidoreductase n=1 Tax=Ilumatobacter coccineus (strain NBRC 103263 / KCTC 29153 / YM16-304) TaxID=1313172 RepID=A0A6C7E1Q5_ILUCY|nr:homogentisate 1,2-dioxygenase [Ilumatobacter coccineus]BAN00840.1 putative oxidoreductase [Ilumatobacter coccineus YM16-304]
MKNSWIHMHRGTVARQARVDVQDLNEEHVSRQGFFGPVAMLYHRQRPADPVRVEGPLAVRMSAVADLTRPDEDTTGGLPSPLFTNDTISVSLSVRSTPWPFLLRNVDADTLLFVHEGEGVIATEFGPLAYEPDDFILLPKGTTHRLMPDTETTMLVVESTNPISFTEHQQVGRHSPIDFGVIGIPEVEEYDWPDQDEWEVRLKSGTDVTSAFYAELPFDVIGWKGDYFPLKINARDVRPITSERLHLAPSSWALFESAGAMIIPFLPMKVVDDPAAEELPSRHRNLDTDELVLIQRLGGKPVNLLGHFPQAVTHGPTERAAYDAIREAGMQRLTNGLSIDTYQRLRPTDAFLDPTERSE